MPTVMVVEDDVTVLALAHQCLQSEGFEVWEAQDAQEAWRMLLEKPPDAAVIDLSLRSERDGWGLVGSIREHTRFPRMPIVIMSGQDKAVVAPRAEELGCGFVAKPFEAQDLIGQVRDAMRQNLRAIRVSLLLPTHTIEGMVHVPGGRARFSDAWEAGLDDGRLFLAVTDARIRPPDGTETKVAFLQVRKADILAVYPVEGD